MVVSKAFSVDWDWDVQYCLESLTKDIVLFTSIPIQVKCAVESTETLCDGDLILMSPRNMKGSCKRVCNAINLLPHMQFMPKYTESTVDQ